MNVRIPSMHISNTMGEKSKDSGYQENTDSDNGRTTESDFHKLDNIPSRKSVHIDAPSIHLSAETTGTNLSLQLDSEDHEMDDASSVSSAEIASTYSFLPINHIDNENLNGNIPLSDRSVPKPVPTPVNLNLRDIMEPLEEWSRVQSSIRERKYPVLPSIGTNNLNKDKQSGKSNYNQLDYTRDRMENEADFFSDFRINTSRVKETPRQNPLPPIRQSSSLGNLNTKR